jgi:hypothetical protein
MANHTQIRLVQVTGSVVDFKPAAITTGVAAGVFGANDLSGSLQYFAQAISNIHGSTEFGGQTRGLIEAPNGSDYDLKFHQLDAGQGIWLDSDGTVADAIDIDSAGGMDVDVAGVLDIDAGDDSVIAVTTSAKDLTVAASGGGTQVLALNSAGTGTNALDINASAGGIDIDAAAAIDILAATTMTIKGAGASKYGDDAATLDFDGAGAVSETGMTSFAVTPSGVLTMQGGGVSKYGDDTAVWSFDGLGAVSETGMTTFSLTPSSTVDIDAGGALTLDGSAITIGGDADVAVDLDASTLDIDASGALTMDSATTVVIAGATGASIGDDTEALAYDGSGNLDLDAVALDVDTSGAINIAAAGAASDIFLSTAHTAGVAFHIDANADAASEVQIDAGILDIDVTGAATLNSSAAGVSIGGVLDSDFIVAGNAQDLVLGVSGGGAQVLKLDSAGTGDSAIDITASAGGIDVDAAGSLDLDGGSINIGTTASVAVDFNASTLDIDSTGALTMNSATTMVLGAADDSSILVSTATKDLTVGVSGGGAQVLKLDSAGTGTDAIDINATAGGLDVDVALAVDVACNAFSITSTDSSIIQVTSSEAAEDLVLQQVGGNDSSIKLVAAGTGVDVLNLNASAGGIDVNSALGLTLDSGGPMALTSTDNTGKTTINHNNGDALAGIKLMTAGTGASALEFLVSGVNGGITMDASGIIDIESSAGDLKLGADNVNRAISIGTAGLRVITLGSSTAQSSVVGNSLVMSGSARMAFSGSLSLSSDGSMTSGDAGGMAFGGYDEFATFRNKSIFSASTTVVGALNTLAANITGATATIFTGSLGANVAPNGNVAVKLLSGDNSTLLPDVGDTKAMVYVNGQLLVSSSIGGINDYKISAVDTLQFQFAMKAGDMVQVIDRS